MPGNRGGGRALKPAVQYASLIAFLGGLRCARIARRCLCRLHVRGTLAGRLNQGFRFQVSHRRDRNSGCLQLSGARRRRGSRQ